MKTRIPIFASLLYLLLLGACSKNDPEPPRNPIGDWQGEYNTRTAWWGESFSPLLITPGGDLYVAGDLIETYTFDPATGQLSFDWHPVNNTEVKASILLERYGDNRTFSGSINPRRQDGPVGFRGATLAHTLWQGAYQTETSFWGAYFSPLVIEPDGTVTIAGTEITIDFNPATEQLRFDWHSIKDTEATAEITFEEKSWNELAFDGRIRPRRQDGWVSYSGNLGE